MAHRRDLSATGRTARLHGPTAAISSIADRSARAHGSTSISIVSV